MGKKNFDYYIYIDYSECLIGYLIIKKESVKECLLQTSRFKHYREAKQRKLYLKNASKTFKKKEILGSFLKRKVRNVLETPEIFADIAEFLKESKGGRIFICVDNRQFSNFEKFVEVIDGENIKIVRESELNKNSQEYKINLILDTWLNIERRKNE